MSPNNTVSILQPLTGSPPTPTPQTHQSSQRVSKAILKTAIQKANSAVVLDKANDLAGAIDAYTEAVNLLDRVLSSETREADRQRLQETYSKYLKRIQYLSALKSDADDLYETFENGGRMGNDQSRTTTKPFQSATTHGKGRSDMWVRKMNSSSSLDHKSNRWEADTTSRFDLRKSGGTTTRSTATNDPSTTTPVSSKSTPSRPPLKSNDTTTLVDPPPLEPRSIHRPSPRKSSRTGAAAALQQQQQQQQFVSSIAEQESSPQRRSSMSSVSSMSSGDSDVIRVSSSHQPTMALPSLLHTKMEVASIPNTVTPSSQQSKTDHHLNSNRNSNPSDDDRQGLSDSTISTAAAASTISLMSNQEETKQQQQQSGFGRLRTSSLPRKLYFTRPVIGSSTRMNRLASNASSLNMDDHSTSVPMRRNATQPITPVTATIDPDTISSRTISAPAPPQRQSSGLSMRKKYNRLSRTSMDGNNNGRKDKSGPIFSTLFGSNGGNTTSPNGGRSSEDAINYFGKDPPTCGGDLQHSPDSDGDTSSTNVAMTSFVPAKQEGTMNRYLDIHLKLIIALEHSMNYGGYITPKLFVPKNLWHQNNIRIPSMDVKMAACESLILDLNRIEKWRNLDDIRGSLRLIESLEEVVDGLQVTLSKKLKQDSIVDINDDTSSVINSSDGSLQSQPYSTGTTGYSNNNNNNNTNNNNNNNNNGSNGNTMGNSNYNSNSINKRAQFMSWGSKLSKSVERMNAFGLNKVEDQHRHYIEVLQKLFIKLHMLEMWFQHYLKKDRQKNPHYDALLTKLGKVCDGINRVVGGFVLRDVAILLGKWLKRGGVWVNE
ncbi:hypothetical protein BC941DRAFT_502742 [Chlamydoabsidia padenii]|nr:hypothetical protein BC941DRAFT_502742 [Chlamydoabsidia padenii]